MMIGRMRGQVDPGSNDTSTYLKYRRFWNDQEVSECALLSPQTARRCLTELAEAKYLRAHLADVVNVPPPVIGGSGGNPALLKHSFVYGGTEPEANKVVLEQAYKVILNLMERKAVEVEKLQILALK